MFGDAWSNPLMFSFDNYNKTIIMDDCYLDLDGCLFEAYTPVGFHLKNSHINLTNYEYGIWNDFRYDCVALGQEDAIAFLIVENNLFTGLHREALYNFIYFASMDDAIIINNTFDGCTYLDMETRPFCDVHP